MQPVTLWTAALIVGLDLALAGCQMASLIMPVDLKPGLGRVDRTFPAPIPRLAPAIFRALDAQRVRPTALSLLAREGVAIDIQGVEEVDSNLKLADSVQGVLLNHQTTGPDGKPMPFEVISLSYKGRAPDGRPVILTAARRDNGTRLAVQVGRLADEAAARTLIGRIAAAPE